MRVDPLVTAAVATIVAFVASYVAIDGKFPFTRTPLRFVLAGFLAFVIGFALLAALAAAQK